MSVFVTGATGFIGRYLVSELVSAGKKVRCLVRETSDTAHIDGLGVEKCVGDIRDASSLQTALEGVEVVYHLGAVSGVKNIPKRAYWEANVTGTKNILDACLNSDVKKIVHASSVVVMGNVGGAAANEKTACTPHGNYAKSKWEAEKLAVDYHLQNSLPVTIIRPGVTYGPYDPYGRVYELARLLKKRFIAYPGGAQNLMHFGHVINVVAGMLLAAEKGRAGESYILVDEKPVRFRELIDTICAALETPSPKITLPAPMFKLAGVFMEPLALIGVEPPLTRFKADVLTKDVYYDIGKAESELGYNPQIDTISGLRSTIEWYRKNNVL